MYDKLGQRWKLRTYRTEGYAWSGSTWPNPAEQDRDETVWTYHAATGLLTAKTYADSSHVDYTYTLDGRLETRIWARTISGNHPNTTYVYDEDTGELTGVEYRVGTSADADTPNVSFTHDRLGRIATVTDAAGVRTMTYDADTLQLVSEAIAGTGGLINRTITRDYADSLDQSRARKEAVGLQL